MSPVTLTFEQARATVLGETAARLTLPAIETIRTLDASVGAGNYDYFGQMF